jgi:hypothetical protein
MFRLSEQLNSPYADLVELAASALARLDTSSRRQDKELYSAYEKSILSATETILNALKNHYPIDKKMFYHHLQSMRTIRTMQFKHD